MENDPSKIKIIVEAGGVNYELTPDNTVGSIHQEENEAYDPETYDESTPEFITEKKEVPLQKPLI